MAEVLPLHTGGENSQICLKPLHQWQTMTLSFLTRDSVSTLTNEASEIRTDYCTIAATIWWDINDIVSAVDKRKHCASLLSMYQKPLKPLIILCSSTNSI